MRETSGPVPALTDALQARDLNRLADLLAPDVLLSVPPLHLTRRGSQDVLGAIVALLQGFGELRYDVRSRYLAPGAVTDEAMLIGRQTGPFLGAEPSLGVSEVAARLLITHDAELVTEITVWPDLAALPQAMSGAARLIDLTRIDQADLVAACHATATPGPPEVIQATTRESPPLLTRRLSLAAERQASGGSHGRPPGRGLAETSIPKPARRRRALVAASALLAASTVITVWVTMSALRAPSAERNIVPATLGHPAGTNATVTGADPAALTIVGDQVTVPADLLFDTGDSRLTPQARILLASLIDQAVRQQRQGLVTVSGHTDNRGSAGHNLELSKQRAQAVAVALQAGLKSIGLTFVASGYGPQNPVGDNETDAGRSLNRRITVAFEPTDR